jgi:hypothetical protein
MMSQRLLIRQQPCAPVVAWRWLTAGFLPFLFASLCTSQESLSESCGDGAINNDLAWTQRTHELRASERCRKHL